MKTFLTIFAFTVVIAGCAHKSAFESFNISKEQERSEDLIQSSKIKSDDKTIGIVSAVYLNKIKPDKFKENEYFYIASFVKKEYPQNLGFYLNKHKALNVKELNTTNEFTSLMQIDADWYRYYLVSFKKEGSLLRLEVKNQAGSSQPMLFNKEE
jgi:hypothetical protein